MKQKYLYTLQNIRTGEIWVNRLSKCKGWRVISKRYAYNSKEGGIY